LNLGKLRASLRGLGLLVLSAALLPSPAADAGFLVVSADSNIIVPLDPTKGAPTPNDNGVFFNNVLNGGKVVQILSSTVSNTTNPGVGTGGVNLDATLSAFYNSQPGVTSSIVTGTITTASLAGVGLFVSDLPDAAFTSSEISALKGLLAAGGSVFLLGDGNGFSPKQNAVINADLIALGSGMLLTPTSNDALQQVATVANGQVLATALTTGVTNFDYAFTSGITGGQRAFLDKDKATSFVSFEGGSPAAVPEPSSVLMASLGLAGLALARRRVGPRGEARPA